MAKLLALGLLCVQALGMDNLKVAFEWKQLDFAYPSEDARQKAIDSKEFIPENNIPLGLEVYENRLFITVPRWKSGVPASLTYINISDTSKSPILQPYPNWEAHKIGTTNTPEIVSPFRIRADKCGRLWVLDTGVADVLGDPKKYSPARLLIYSLQNDALLRRYDVPLDQLKDESFLANLAVEDNDCDDTYAYLGDLGKAAIVVYSWKNESSWRVTHNYFNMDPEAGEFNVSGIAFRWNDAVFGLALSSPDPKGHSTLYFHPMVSTYEFSVNTEILKDPTLAKTSYHNFTILGNRGPKSQSSASFLDKKTNVLFYALVNLNAVACWRTTNPKYTMESQGRIFMSNVTMVFPNDIKVDHDDNLWVLSDKLPVFMYSTLNASDVNFRILKATVQDAIRGTACDSKLLVAPDMVGRFKPTILTQGQNKSETIKKSGAFRSTIFVFLVMLCSFVTSVVM